MEEDKYIDSGNICKYKYIEYIECIYIYIYIYIYICSITSSREYNKKCPS